MMERRTGNTMVETKESERYGVVASNLTLSAGTKELIYSANFAISAGRKIALIGRNGSGKTTLLDTIDAVAEGIEPPDHIALSGNLTVLPETVVGYLPQSVQVSYQGTVKEYLDSCSEEIAQTAARYDRVVSEMEKKSSDEELLEEYGELLEEMNRLNAWDFPRKRRVVFAGLGLSEEYLRRDVREVSGGEATKVALAGILLSPSNLILLDEPTNNLDPQSLFFLEEWVKESTFSLLLVSHDREFLDKTIDEILEIDEDSREVLRFGGNYSFYRKKKEEMFEAQMRAYEEQQKKRKRLEEDAERLRKRAAEFETISDNAFYRAKGAKIAKQAKSRLERVERELSQIPEPQPPKRPTLTVQETQKTKGLVLEVKDVAFSYNGENLFENVTFTVRAGERVGIIGPNGVGKSTLLKSLMGELKPNAGQVSLASRLRVGYLPQALLVQDSSLSVTEFVRDRIAISVDDAKELLGRVLFTDPAPLRVGNFSFGELRRIEFVVLFADKPDLIVLDEPTNHLDVYTIEMLEDALSQFNGSVIAVSHDLRLLKNLKPNKLMVFDSQGRVTIKKPETVEALENEFRKAFEVGPKSS